MTRPESDPVGSPRSQEAESFSDKTPLSARGPSKEFLRSTPIIDWEQSEIRSLAARLAGDLPPLAAAARCFDWVRDEVRHSADSADHRVTLIASDVLRFRTGMCYAKSHLLAAMLRSIGIPCGFAYQRLVDEQSSAGFCLHGLNGVWLEAYGWYRIDPRGNREGVSTRFDPPTEILAYTPRCTGETMIDRVFSDPLAVVVESLSKHDNVSALCEDLPDWDGVSLFELRS